MIVVYTPKYEVDIGPHVFPTSKYRLVCEKLLKERLVSPAELIEPPRPTRAQLELVHTPEYLDDLANLRWTPRTMRSELPISADIVEAYMLAAGGTTLACCLALSSAQKICVHLGGGFHHAFADHAEGFCYINDIAVAIRAMQQEGRIRRAMVVDCDLHQGNGTAHIFRNDPSVFTFSIHQENNYPIKQTSDLDIGLEDEAGDQAYMDALRSVFPSIAERHAPELLVYVAGADPYEEDLLGVLRLSLAGLRARDEFVLQQTAMLGIPAAVVLAGGYACGLEDLIEIHAQTCRAAHKVCRDRLAADQ